MHPVQQWIYFLIAFLIAFSPYWMTILPIFIRRIPWSIRSGFLAAVPIPFIVEALRAPEPVAYDVPLPESIARTGWWFEQLGASILACMLFPAISYAITHAVARFGRTE